MLRLLLFLKGCRKTPAVKVKVSLVEVCNVFFESSVGLKYSVT